MVVTVDFVVRVATISTMMKNSMLEYCEFMVIILFKSYLILTISLWGKYYFFVLLLEIRKLRIDLSLVKVLERILKQGGEDLGSTGFYSKKIRM